MSDEVVYHNTQKFEEHGEKLDRGLFDFVGKKEEENKCEEAAISSELEQKVHVSEPESKSEEKKESLLGKLHRSDSSSSSSSDEECENGEKKKKKSLKEKIKEKIGECKNKKDEDKIEKHETDTCVPIEKYDEVAVPPPSSEVVHTTLNPAPEEKRGLMEKIKEKLPGGHKKTEEEHVPPQSPHVLTTHGKEGEHKEKKGILEKIKKKIPGCHSKSEEEKEKVKECD